MTENSTAPETTTDVPADVPADVVTTVAADGETVVGGDGDTAAEYGRPKDAPVHRNYPAWWTDLDTQAVDTARLLAADAVQKSGSGHPGTAMSLAPLAYLLYQRVMRVDPADPQWPGRDRFLMSNGHAVLTQYTELFLAGYGLELDDLKALRTWGSLTPGHPEYSHTAGVEITTGPLGQGVANGVGMAMAARRERGLFDPDAEPGTSPFDHQVYVIAGDGCMQEGVASEASSLAATQRLGNLTVFWDDNRISIEDDVTIAFTEDVAARYEAYGWHVQYVESGEDVAALEAAIEAARAVTDRPSFIAVRTIIGWPAPTLQGTGKSHGAALGDDEIAATKEFLGFDPAKSFDVDPAVLGHTRAAVDRGRAAKAEWQKAYDAWAGKNRSGKALHDRLATRTLPDGWTDALPQTAHEKDGKAATLSTRKASEAVLTALAGPLPELWGGSADLAESNNTTMKGEPSFLPSDRQSKMFTGGPYGRTLHFGIREHAMGAIMNGISVHGGTRVYGGTFLIFSDYMRPPVRLAAMMHQPTIYVWTHDSIGLGGDGPTHQPIEQLAALRAIPGLNVARPADANETAAVWRKALETTDSPTALALSRQNLPVIEASRVVDAGKGAYVLEDASEGLPDLILIGTGSEVALAVAARERLEAEGVRTRVVSMPCQEWFKAQPQSYQQQVLPPGVKARVSVEAGIAMGWRDWVGDAGESVSIEHFGASAEGDILMEQFGFTVDAVVTAAHTSLQRATQTSAPVA